MAPASARTYAKKLGLQNESSESSTVDGPNNAAIIEFGRALEQYDSGDVATAIATLSSLVEKQPGFRAARDTLSGWNSFGSYKNYVEIGKQHQRVRE